MNTLLINLKTAARKFNPSRFAKPKTITFHACNTAGGTVQSDFVKHSLQVQRIYRAEEGRLYFGADSADSEHEATRDLEF